MARYQWHAGEVIVADRGYGYRRSVATAQRYPVRLVAAQLAPTATRCARRRACRTAHQAGRTITTPPLAVAGGLLRITTLAAATGATADGL